MGFSFKTQPRKTWPGLCFPETWEKGKVSRTPWGFLVLPTPRLRRKLSALVSSSIKWDDSSTPSTGVGGLHECTEPGTGCGPRRLKPETCLFHLHRPTGKWHPGPQLSLEERWPHRRLTVSVCPSGAHGGLGQLSTTHPLSCPRRDGWRPIPKRLVGATDRTAQLRRVFVYLFFGPKQPTYTVKTGVNGFQGAGLGTQHPPQVVQKQPLVPPL